MSRAALDLAYYAAVPFMLRRYETLTLCLAGCGGTGAWLAPHLARLARVLNDRGIETRLLLVDPDVVELQNLARQNFCAAEVGRPKAQTLAARYGAALGLEIQALVARFDPAVIENRWRALTVVIGCVDNAAARQALARTLASNHEVPGVLWLDCGNARESGQVLLGSALRAADLREAFAVETLCTALPAPSLQAPGLLTPLPDEAAIPAAPSCAELAATEAQSPAVNQTAAAIATDYLARLLLNRDLRRFATVFDLASGSMRSRYITPGELAAVLGAPPGRLFKRRSHASHTRRAESARRAL